MTAGRPRILLVEDDAAVRTTVATFLECEGYPVDAAASSADAMERLAGSSYPIVISDIYIDERTGLDVLKAARRRDPVCAVILMTARGTMETVMEATRGGAFDYIAKPFELDRLLESVQRAEAALGEVEEEPWKDEPLETEMVGASPAMVELYKLISRAAPTDATVLIEGETGTGKEMVARMIHANSARSQGPFLPVDCASIAPTLLESELFGHVRGAFTGADRDRAGVLEAANRGTVLLDEIGEVDLNFQPKLLRFLQEREIRPVGSAKSKAVAERRAHPDPPAAGAPGRRPAAGAAFSRALQFPLWPEPAYDRGRLAGASGVHLAGQCPATQAPDREGRHPDQHPGPRRRGCPAGPGRPGSA
jgi:DNA-binding NtrC family response regulator